MTRAKQIFGLACITVSASTMVAVALIAAHNASMAINEYLDSLAHVLGGGV